MAAGEGEALTTRHARREGLPLAACNQLVDALDRPSKQPREEPARPRPALLLATKTAVSRFLTNN